MQVNVAALQFTTVQNLGVPPEGPKAAPLTLDFSQTSSYQLNFQSIIDQNYVSVIQAMYIDNSLNPQPLSITMQGSNQTITIAPGRQAYLNVLAPYPVQVSFSTTGVILVRISLLNFPVTNHDWPAYTGA